MHNTWIFSCPEYRMVLERQINESGSRGYRSLLARAAGCQPAYLSQVMSGAVQLTPEQASGLCDLWRFSELESDYFLTLVHLGRAGQPGLRDRLKRKLERLQAQHENEKKTALLVEAEAYAREKALFYYLDWIPSAVHLCLMIPHHDTAAAIAKRLRLEEEVVRLTLQTLEELGLIVRENFHWKLTAKSLHADDESLFAAHHHRNWREKAKEYFRNGRVDQNFHFTAVYSLDRQAFQTIKKELARLVEQSRTTTIPAAEETLACLNIDWFEV